MLTQEPRSRQGPGLLQLQEKILALKSGSLVPTRAPHGMSKQTGTPDHGEQGLGRLRLQDQRDGFSSRMLQCLTRDEILVSQNGSARPPKATSCVRGSMEERGRS